MVKKTLLGSILLLLIANVVSAKALTLYEIQEATFQVFNGKVQGTATCANETTDAYLFITNAHVVGNSTNVSLYGFRSGYISKKAIPATVSWRAYQRGTLKDIAVLKAKKSSFGNYPPRIINIVPEGYKVKPKHFIYSAGCQHSQWPMSWVGHAENINPWITFQPAPAPGQSGSALLCLIDVDGEWQTRVCGIVTWTDGNNKTGIGGAVPISVYYDLLNKNQVSNPANTRIPVSFKEVSNEMYAVYPTINDTQLSKPEYAIVQCGPYGCEPQYVQPNAQRQQVWPFNNDRRILPEQPIIPPQGIIRPRESDIPPSPDDDLFDNNIPNLGEVWPNRNTPSEEPIIEQPETVPELPLPENNVQQEVILETKPRGWFRYLRDKEYGWLQALGLAGILGIAAAIWRNILRKRVDTALDKVEDQFEVWVASRLGAEVADDIRDVIEVVEAAVIGYVDNAAQTTKQAKKEIENTKKEKLEQTLAELSAGANKKPVAKKTTKKTAPKTKEPKDE